MLAGSVLLGISLTLAAISPNGLLKVAFDEVVAQNQTAANQTTAAGQNQTVANVTLQEFQPLELALSDARTAILENDTGVAYRALSSAQDEIFDLTHVSEDETQGQFEVAKAKALGEQLKPVRDSIDEAKGAVWNDDSGSSLTALGSGELALFKITSNLPSGEEEGG